MKTRKLLFVLAIAMSTFTLASAQELGVRFGSYAGNGGVALDGVFSTSEFSRIHADISFGNGVGADFLFDFIYRPISNEAFNWYMGVGPYLYLPFQPGNLSFGAVGEIGLLYAFNSIPFTLSIDWRPYFQLIETTNIYYGGFGLNFRYVF